MRQSRTAELLGMLGPPNELEASEELFRVCFTAKRVPQPQPDDGPLGDEPRGNDGLPERGGCRQHSRIVCQQFACCGLLIWA